MTSTITDDSLYADAAHTHARHLTTQEAKHHFRYTFGGISYLYSYHHTTRAAGSAVFAYVDGGAQ